MLLALLAVLAVHPVLAPTQDAKPAHRRFPAQGFSIAAPGADWTVLDGREAPDGFHVDVTLKESNGMVAASVLTLPLPEDADAAGLVAKSLVGLPARDEYVSHRVLEDVKLGGCMASGVQLEWDVAGAGRLCIVQRYIVEDQRVYLLQAHAPLDDWEAQWPSLEACFASFARIEASDQEAADMMIPLLAAKCGSEAAWAADWGDAIARAKSTGRHILVVVRSYPGFDIPDSTAISTFMHEDVLALVRTRLVPLRLAAGDPAPIRDANVYGMSPSTFGVALLLVNADGEVLADTPHVNPEVCLPWLRTQLKRFPEPAEAPKVEGSLEAAELHLDRGELGLASDKLDTLLGEGSGVAHAPALRLRARLHRLRQDGPAALVALEEARAAGPEDLDAIDCERAYLLLREGRADEARTILEESLNRAGDDALPETMLLMAAALQYLKGLEAALPWFQRLVKEHPTDRSAWLAAVSLENEALLRASKSRGALGWPRADVLAFLAEPARAPKPSGYGKEAAAEALGWLEANQRDDGSWPCSTDLRLDAALPPHAIAVAIDALASQALLRLGQDSAKSGQAGLAFLMASDERQRALSLPILYMDYTAWAAWAQLELVADQLTAGGAGEAELKAFGARLVADLAERVRGNGGWSYYLSGDAEGTTAVEQSISFTTAAAVIGLIRAKDAGVDVPAGLIENALNCLEAMRADSGLFAYMLYHPGNRATHNPPRGSAGRGPACELALWLGGRSSEERLTATLDLFIEHSPALAGEVGKALMHAGADTQGCHYPLFDYMMAARAVSKLPAAQQERYRVVLLDLLMGTRLEDGSFQDTPIMGRAYGTSATLLSLQALGR